MKRSSSRTTGAPDLCIVDLLAVFCIYPPPPSLFGEIWDDGDAENSLDYHAPGSKGQINFGLTPEHVGRTHTHTHTKHMDGII